MLNRDADCAVDVDARIGKAAAAFGKLKPLVFKSKNISLPAKRAAYVVIVMSILLYGSEMWVLSATSRRKLRSFHHRCLRVMCGVNMWHVKERKITMSSLLDDANLRSIDTYLARRRLRWIGHVRRMDWDRTPRKLLSSWCYQARPLGRPCLRWAESIEEDLRLARLPITKWHLKAENRIEWKSMIQHLGEPKSKIKKRRVQQHQKQKTRRRSQNQN